MMQMEMAVMRIIIRMMGIISSWVVVLYRKGEGAVGSGCGRDCRLGSRRRRCSGGNA